MTDNDILYPQTIDPVPLPSMTGQLVLPSQQPSNSTTSQQMQPQQSVAERFPEKFVAPEVISQ